MDIDKQKQMCRAGGHNAVLKMTSDAIDKCMKRRFYAIKDHDDALLQTLDSELDSLERAICDLKGNNHYFMQ